jgi:hypothetical protein
MMTRRQAIKAVMGAVAAAVVPMPALAAEATALGDPHPCCCNSPTDWTVTFSGVKYGESLNGTYLYEPATNTLRQVGGSARLTIC